MFKTKKIKLSSKILNIHFIMNWKIILLFALFWLFLVSLMSFLSINNGKIIYSSGYFVNNIIPSPAHNEGSSSKTFDGLSSFYELLFTFLGYSFFGIVIITILYLNFSRELMTGKMCFWMTKQISRNNLFFSKIIFSIIEILIIYIPGFLVALTFMCCAKDRHDFIGYFLYDKINYLLFIIFIFALFGFIYISLMKWSYLWVMVCGVLLTYMITTQFFIEFLKDGILSCNWIKYISLQSLMCTGSNFDTTVEILPKTFIHGHEEIDYSGFPEGFSIVTYPIIKPLLFWEILSPIALISLSSVLVYAFIKIIDKKDFNI